MNTTQNYEPLYSQRPSFINRVFLVLISLYKKLISPWLPGRCRFYPSCSAYAKESFEKLEFHEALLKSIWRILRCNPFSEGYFDPVIPEPDHAVQTKEHL